MNLGEHYQLYFKNLALRLEVAYNDEEKNFLVWAFNRKPMQAFYSAFLKTSKVSGDPWLRFVRVADFIGLQQLVQYTVVHKTFINFDLTVGKVHKTDRSISCKSTLLFKLQTFFVSIAAQFGYNSDIRYME